MKIIKEITCIGMILLFVTASLAQKHKGNRKEHKEKIQAMKVSYITEKLDLTPTEAQQFWPIYNEFDDKMESIHRAIRKTHKKDDSIDNMTDAEVEEMVNTINKLRQEDLNIFKEYHSKFKAIIPIKKVAKLYKAEHDFKRELLKKLKIKKGGPNEMNIPPPPPKGRH
jgi:hypothetical protein